MKVSIVLSDIRSAHNVGSVFRTADAAGVGVSGGTIFLCGYTPAPQDEFGRERPDIAKVALGAEKIVAWQKEKSTVRTIRNLQKSGAYVVAIEQAPRAIDVTKLGTKLGPRLRRKKHIAFVFGNETKGLPKNILAACDAVAEIPMRGEKESLNVSVAVGITLYAC